jgi:predicted aspartyl protease
MARQMRGRVDARRRPIIDLSFAEPAGAYASIPALVDTGFNGDVIVEGGRLRDIPCRLLDWYEHVDVVGGTAAVRVAESSVHWLGEVRTVTVLITLSDKTPRRGDPIAAVGTRLLHPASVTIDFLEEFVSIAAA